MKKSTFRIIILIFFGVFLLVYAVAHLKVRPAVNDVEESSTTDVKAEEIKEPTQGISQSENVQVTRNNPIGFDYLASLKVEENEGR